MQVPNRAPNRAPSAYAPPEAAMQVRDSEPRTSSSGARLSTFHQSTQKKRSSKTKQSSCVARRRHASTQPSTIYLTHHQKQPCRHLLSNTGIRNHGRDCLPASIECETNGQARHGKWVNDGTETVVCIDERAAVCMVPTEHQLPSRNAQERRLGKA